MGAIEEIYEELEADISIADFRAAVEEKVEQMGGLADDETAAMLVAHELGDDDVNTIADIEAGMDEVSFLAKVMSVGELRTFERDDDDEPGRVINVEAADETGTIRLSFWDEHAQAVVDDGLDPGTVLRIRGGPREGYDGVEVSVYQAEVDPDAEIGVDVRDVYRVEDLTLGRSDVTFRGQVLGVEQLRTFTRNDGSEGRVSNLAVGDETGRIRVTMWDDRAEFVETVEIGDSIEIVDGYVRERDDALELHVGDRGDIRVIDADIEYVPRTTPIADLELDQTADIGGVIRSVDPIRTFDRDDGSEGKVRNVRLQDESGDIRVALWGEQAEIDIGPGDTAVFADVRIKDGWQDDLEASAGWRSTVTITDQPIESTPRAAAGSGPDLTSFTSGQSSPGSEVATESIPPSQSADSDVSVEFTGTVVQTGDPVVLDDGTETMTVETDADLTLGQQVTVRGRREDDRFIANEVI